MLFKRIFLVVLDGVGIGETVDSINYDDSNTNTLLHTIENSNYNLDILEKLGLLNLVGYNYEKTRSLYMRGKPINESKDSLNGHYEMMCALSDKKFKTYPDGFPLELISELQHVFNKDIIGNIASSGTGIIDELGEMHIRTGALIVYTSGDSVLQIAAHEELVPLETLYSMCEKALEIVSKEPYNIARVIARPFSGKIGSFVRTNNRKDFTIEPPINVIDLLDKASIETISIGKVADLFNNRGFNAKVKTTDNIDTMLKLVDFAKGNFNGLVFANLNDFDTKYGHRRDKEGFLKALEEFNYYLPIFLKYLNEDDLLIITADHGNDPTHKGSDHTREYVPIILYNKEFKVGKQLSDRSSLADIGATILDNYKINNNLGIGNSIFDELRNKE